MWNEGFVEAELGITVVDPDDSCRDLMRLAVRRNPRRAYLIVSTVLGKHLPVSPSRVRRTGNALGALVREALGLDCSGVVVIGFAETATALGYEVAEALHDSYYVHTTRRPDEFPLVSFSESHSHATSHYLCPTDPEPLAHARVVVLVDDEVSTGRTVEHAITAIVQHSTCAQFVVASIIDSRSQADRDHAVALVAELGGTLTSVCLAPISVKVATWTAETAAAFVAATPEPLEPATTGPSHVPIRWRVEGLRVDGRLGLTQEQRDAIGDISREIARTTLDTTGGRRVTVLGVEEFMMLPTLVAEAIERAGREVVCLSTTRSPIVVMDRADYPIRTRLAYGASGETRFVHNLPADAGVNVLVAPDDPDATLLIEALGGLGTPLLVWEVRGALDHA